MNSDDRQLKVYVPEKLSEVKPLRRPPLVPERVDVFEGDGAAEDKVAGFLARMIPSAGEARETPAGALVPWVCDVLLSEHSVKGYGRDLAHFARHMRKLGVDPLNRAAGFLTTQYCDKAFCEGVIPDHLLNEALLAKLP